MFNLIEFCGGTPFYLAINTYLNLLFLLLMFWVALMFIGGKR